MKGSKSAVSTQENSDHAPNPTINALVESVGSHASESDRETLAKLILFGDTWKAKGEKMEKEWWSDRKLGNSSDGRKLFHQRCINFYKLKKIRKEKEEENLKELFSNDMMEGYLLDKYIEEYLYKWILYYPSEMDEEVVEEDGKEVEGYDNVLTYLHAGNIEPGVVIDLTGDKPGPRGAKEIAEAIKVVGLAPGVMIDLGWNNIGDDGAKYLALAIKEVGLPPGVTIDLTLNRIGDDGAKYLALAIKEVGLAPGVAIELCSNNIGPDGAKAIALAIKAVGLASGVMINLWKNNIGPDGAKELAVAIKKVGLPPGVEINLGFNDIGPKGAKKIAEAIKIVGFAPGVVIYLSWNHIGDIGANYIIDAIQQKGLPSGAEVYLGENNFSPEMKEQLSELNKTVEGKIIFN